jgi:hypothetical protein
MAERKTIISALSKPRSTLGSSVRRQSEHHPDKRVLGDYSREVGLATAIG